jgi:hypothetical protein
VVFCRHPRGLRGVWWVYDDALTNVSSLVTPGLHIVLAIACVRAIRRSTAFTDYPRRAHIAIAYVVVLFTIATLNIGVKTAEWVDLFVDQRLLPSGPALTGVLALRTRVSHVADNVIFVDDISRMD